MTVDKEPPEDPDVHAAAIAWWVKCDAGPLSRSDRDAFEAWLAPSNFDSAGRQIAGLTELREKRERK